VKQQVVAGNLDITHMIGMCIGGLATSIDPERRIWVHAGARGLVLAPEVTGAASLQQQQQQQRQVMLQALRSSMTHCSNAAEEACTDLTQRAQVSLMARRRRMVLQLPSGVFARPTAAGVAVQSMP
jgi:hypothetical protein